MTRWYKHGKPLLQEIAASSPQAGEVYIWFAGQHGFIIKVGSIVVYIDVVLNDFLDKNGNSIRAYPPPFDPSEIQSVDYVICTHNHGDHLNLETLLPLAEKNTSVKFIVPAPCKRILTKAGIPKNRVFAAKVGDNITLSSQVFSCELSKHIRSELSILPVSAIHTKYIQDEGEKDKNGDYTALGFILKSEGITMYHSGDTWVTPSLVESLKTHAPLDLAMLPINGTDWERTMEGCIGNTSCLDAVKLALSVPIDLVIPSHYDMMPNNSENPARFVDYMYTLCPEKRFHVCALGERFIFHGGYYG